MTSEADYLRMLESVFHAQSEEIEVGIGDDAAVIAPQKRALALSTDMAVEGTHFNRQWSSLYEIGGKVTAANLADIFAMGGRPKFLLVAAAIPTNFSLNEIKELAQGIQDEASKVRAYVVGGDLTRSALLTIAVTVFGDVENPILRSGAKVGDYVCVSELPGKSSRGLELLKSGIFDEQTLDHRHPIVNYEKISHLDRLNVNSLTDVSDGLISELSGIAEASKVRIELDSAKFPCNQYVLHGGEDHVFVGTFTALPDGWFKLGSVVSGTGVYLDGTQISHQGFEHF